MTTIKSTTPLVLNKLATLTRIRDIEVFELSVLKTLAELLKINQLVMYKFDRSQTKCRLLSYSSEKKWNKNRSRVSEQQEVQIEYRDVPEFIKSAKDWIESTNQAYIRQDGDKILCVYPVVGAQDIVGYLAFEPKNPFNEMESVVITCILGISHNFHSLLEENQQDKLTGLLNRKTFEENISKIQDIVNEIEVPQDFEGTDRRVEGHDDNFWLAIMDIDHFKKINDNYGHVYGDEVLLLVARMMQKNFRNSDLLFRFGGEEFVAILRSNTKENAEMVLERFRKAVESFKFPRIDSVTISIGATMLDQRHAVPADIVGRADQALYYAKDQGRNQLYFFEDLVAKGTIVEKIDEGSIELF